MGKKDKIEEVKAKLWVLTEEFNDYDQHGAYFRAAWLQKPTIEQLAKVTGMHNEFGYLDRLLAGGGREEHEHHWYCLDEVEEGEGV